jgi:hypothetical protein
MVRELWGFKDFSLVSGMLSATASEAKFAQNCPSCPKLPKSVKIYPKKKLWNTTKNRDFSVFKIKTNLCV